MISLWIILAILAALLWTIVALIDKIVLTHEMRDPILATTIAGISTFLIFVTISLILGESIFIPFYLIVLLLVASVSYNLAIYFYFSAIKKGEVSRVVAFLSISPIFVFIFAFIFFNERLAFLNYLGIISIVFGSFLISIKKDHSRYIFSSAFFAAILAALFLAFRDLFVKFATIQYDVWSLFFWLGIGSGVTAFLLFYKHHPHILKKGVKGIKHLFLGRILSAIALLIFFLAVSLESVSLVSALTKIEIFFVFILATSLSYFHPKFIKEKISSKIFLQKIIAIIFIISGVFLIT